MEGEVHLVNGDSQNEGTVEICNSNLWGLISDSDWDDDDAEVVCRQLGYTTTSMYIHACVRSYRFVIKISLGLLSYNAASHD